eukprot:scaffold248211_cov17-Prasinocladus_malaysianus.AAC.1
MGNSLARQALGLARQVGVLARPYVEASAASRRIPASQLKPPTARPKTTSAVARRCEARQASNYPCALGIQACYP